MCVMLIMLMILYILGLANFLIMLKISQHWESKSAAMWFAMLCWPVFTLAMICAALAGIYVSRKGCVL
jgi:succinate-acetate transporter protein